MKERLAIFHIWDFDGIVVLALTSSLIPIAIYYVMSWFDASFETTYARYVVGLGSTGFCQFCWQFKKLANEHGFKTKRDFFLLLIGRMVEFNVKKLNEIDRQYFIADLEDNFHNRYVIVNDERVIFRKLDDLMIFKLTWG